MGYRVLMRRDMIHVSGCNMDHYMDHMDHQAPVTHVCYTRLGGGNYHERHT